MNTHADAVTSPRLTRANGHGPPAAPVRMLHLGLGNFFRAHQAWYTHRAPDAASWGIAAFTGRSAAMADALAPQDGLYTLITRHPHGDELEVVSSLAAVHAATDHAAWLGYWASPDLAILTLTVTEAGYLRSPDGRLDLTRPDVQADLSALHADHAATVATTPGKIVAGYLARRAAGAGPIAVLPCDNLPDNGPALRRVLSDFIEAVDPSLADWADENVAFGTTMVDRITPATTEEHRAAARAALGVDDEAPVPTEPFSEWVIAGTFPRGRPAWDEVGARVVDDVVPYEQRKLWLLNGAHSLLAYAGSARGHETVAEAVGDPVLGAWVQEWWDEATAHLTLPAEELAAYRDALLERFSNARIRHVLAQIASDGSQKIPVRIVPVLRAELAAGRVPTGATRVVAAWVNHLRGLGAAVKDARSADVAPLGQGSLEQSVEKTLAFLGEDLRADEQVRSAVLAHARELAAPTKVAGR